MTGPSDADGRHQDHAAPTEDEPAVVATDDGTDSVPPDRSEGGALLTDLVRYVPSQIVPAVVGLVSIPVFTRLFEPDAYGDYRLVLVTVMVFGAIGGALPPGIVRFYPRAEKDGTTSTLVATSRGFWALLTVTSLAVWGAGLFLPFLGVQADLRMLMLIGMGVFVGNSLFGMLQAFFRAQRLATWFSLSTAWRAAAGFAIGVALVVAGGLGVDGLLWGLLAAMVLALPVMWRRSLGRFAIGASIDWGLARQMAAFSFPLVAAAVASWVLRLSDNYIIGFFRDTSEVGIYGAVYGLAEQSIGVLVALFQVAFVPIAARVWEREGPEQSAKFVRYATRFYILLAVPAVVGISTIAEPLVELMTAPAYQEGFRIIPLVASAAFVMGLRTWYGAAFQFHRTTLPYTLSLLAGAVVSVGLNLLAIPRFGYVAAAVNTVIGYAVSMAVMIPWSRRLMKFSFPWRSLIRSLIVSAAMGVVVYGLNELLSGSIGPVPALFVAIAVGVAIVFGGYIGLREVDRGELRRLLRR